MTTCKTIRKLLYPFADGQLEVKDSCEVLDHLKMCPGCSRVVHEHQTVRSSLRRGVAAVPVPAHIVGAVRSKLQKPAVAKPGRGPWPWMPIAASLAAAAGLAFAVLAVRGIIVSGPGAFDRDAHSRITPDHQAVGRVVERHKSCIARQGEHHHPDLSRNSAELKKQLLAHNGERVAVVVPDLSAFGFVLASANYCGIQDADCKKGEHLVFMNSRTQQVLSFFSVPRWDQLDPCHDHRAPGELVPRIFDDPGGDLITVLHWNQDATTYVLCGAMDEPSLEGIADAIRQQMN